MAGVGSTILGDDGVGIHVVRRLEAEPLPDGVEVLELGTGGLALLDVIAGYDRLILIDASLSGVEPGTVRERPADQVEGTAHLASSHEADLPTTLAVGRRTMGRRLPPVVTVLAVEAANLTTFSESLSPEVEAAIPEAVTRVRRILARAP